MLQLYKAITKTYQEDVSCEALRDIVPYIYADQAPFGTEYPLITFGDQRSSNNPTMCNDIETVPMEFKAYAKTSEEALRVSYLIKMAYANNILTLEDSLTMLSAQYKSQRKILDFGNSIWVVTTLIDYTITGAI